MYIFTPVFKEGVEEDGGTIYANDRFMAMDIFSALYDVEDLDSVEMLGKIDDDSWEVQDFKELWSEYF